MKNKNQLILFGSFLPFCWLGFMAVHELGHVLAAVGTGGQVQKVVVHPLAISRTDIQPNPSPLVTVWAGPLVGVVLPIAIWACFKLFKWSCEFLARFFAGFCCVANGGYIGVGSFERIGDAGAMLSHGSAIWALWIFGIVCAVVGFWLWHGQGAKFGLGQGKGQVDERAAYVSLTLFVVLYVATFAFSPRF